MTWICYVEEVSSFRWFMAGQINWLRKYIEPKNSDLAGHYKGSFYKNSKSLVPSAQRSRSCLPSLESIEVFF